jgi:arginine:ornithine antiporter/lysine permease
VLSLFSKSAYQFFYFIASVAILPPYVFSGAYALKLALSGETYQAADRRRNRDIIIGAVATLYGLWLVYAAGLSYLLMCAVLFVPGVLVYIRARQEAGQRAFTTVEAVIAVAIVALGVYAGWLMWTGEISPF